MDQEKSKVLVIDDSKDTRDLIAGILSDDGFEPLVAPGGREGFQVAKNKKPDLILLDLMMPHINGFQTCKVLKKNPATKDIPVIFLTADHNPDNVKTAIQCGARDYIVKPFGASELLTRIHGLLHKEKPSFDTGSVVQIDHLPEEMRSPDQPGATAPTTAAAKSSAAPPDIGELSDICDIKELQGVAVVSMKTPRITMNEYALLRNAVGALLTKGVSRVALDIKSVREIDGTGLGFLVSMQQTLEQEGGDLRITLPHKTVNNRFSFININAVLQTSSSVDDAVTELRAGSGGKDDAPADKEEGAVCLSCSQINPAAFRHCGYCGSDLTLGREDVILKKLREKVSKSVISESDKKKASDEPSSPPVPDDVEVIPGELDVEIISDDCALRYVGFLVNADEFEDLHRIRITPPKVRGVFLPLPADTPIMLRNPKTGDRSSFETSIIAYDSEAQNLSVHYTAEARMLHSRKTFYVETGQDISVRLVDPYSSDETDMFFLGDIEEISRQGMKVRSSDGIPMGQCLSMEFVLPNEKKINSPLALALAGTSANEYDLEFVVIDEKEGSEIIQYTYQRQIEQKKGKADDEGEGA
jgi:anti-anti-sigma factor